MKGGRVSQWKAAAGLLVCVMIFASAERPVFTNHFLVELHKGGEEEARQVAAEHGFGVRKLPFAEGLYHFYHNGLAKVKRRRSLHHKQQLERDPRVKIALQQEGFNRKKRGYRDINEIEINMNDPLFTKQWYLINTGQADGTPGLDLNVAEAWELGYTGKGVTIGIMDDGIDYLHPDLASNY
ncbi:neuroendocrine convertase 2 isoform X2 [Sorex araneus]|nr:neuroendocrine convertase 2 isoform X2 [Sorex araneus]